jgi:ABC-type multidrug transport system ATPase subunit
MPALVSFSKVSKFYGSHFAVGGFTLDIGTGDTVGLLGPNGAGKSTLLHMLTGLVRPTSGQISVFGKDLRTHSVEITSRMGALVERPTFYDHLTVRRNLKIHAALAQREVSLDRTLDLTNLLELESEKAGTLSQGLRQRLGLALAMLTEPELLILDEPTLGLDPEATQDILSLLRRLADEGSITILFSSHLMHEVEALCSHVAILNKGRLVSFEETESLISYDLSQIEVLMDGAESAAKRLRDQDWVEEVTGKPGRLIVRLTEQNSHQLSSFLVHAGYAVSGVIPQRRTLQDYFLKALDS